MRNSCFYLHQFEQQLAHIYLKKQTGLKKLYKLVSLTYTTQNFAYPTLFYQQVKDPDLIICSSPFFGDV
jgi:DNA polymerase III alpha subunit (gram-positive type)